MPPSLPSVPLSLRLHRQATRPLAGGRLRARACPLPDRWAYYVRADAVREAWAARSQPQDQVPQQQPAPSSQRPSSTPPAAAAGGGLLAGGGGKGAFPRDVVQAVESLEDGASELVGGLQGLAALLEAMAGRSSQGSPAGVDPELIEVAASELRDLMAPVVSDAGGGTPSGWGFWDVVRLSYAPFASDAVAAAAGMGGGEGGEGEAGGPLASRRVAMECVDVGERLEEAVGRCKRLSAGLSARLAVM